VDWVESDYSLGATMRFARAGARVRVQPAPDACDACKAMAARTYLASEVPRLPIRGCTRERCRCTFVAVDPETDKSVPELVEWGIRTLKSGRKRRARHILQRALELDNQYEPGWLWLTAAVDDQAKIACLEKALEINPGNEYAQATLERLRSTPASPLEDSPKALAAAKELPSSPPGDAAEPLVAVAQAPPEIVQLRQERTIILGQWSQFLAVAANLDAHTLLEQGRAFLQKIDDLCAEALVLVSKSAQGEQSGQHDWRPQELRLQELQVQWQETIELTAALADTSQAHEAVFANDPGWLEAREALQLLGRRLSERREALGAELLSVGGSPPA
jgi:hypothetical protein